VSTLRRLSCWSTAFILDLTFSSEIPNGFYYSNNGLVAIAFFDLSVHAETGKGVYFSGTASEIGADLAEKAFRLLAARSGEQPKTTAQDYLNSSPRRIYQF
jgi:hypothetical protein